MGSHAWTLITQPRLLPRGSSALPQASVGGQSRPQAARHHAHSQRQQLRLSLPQSLPPQSLVRCLLHHLQRHLQRPPLLFFLPRRPVLPLPPSPQPVAPHSYATRAGVCFLSSQPPT